MQCNHIRTSGELQREIIAFIMVPDMFYDARADLKEILKTGLWNQESSAQAPLCYTLALWHGARQNYQSYSSGRIYK